MEAYHFNHFFNKNRHILKLNHFNFKIVIESGRKDLFNVIILNSCKLTMILSYKLNNLSKKSNRKIDKSNKNIQIYKNNFKRKKLI